MAEIGIMIEGSRGLNWARWKRLLQTAEDCGFQSVFRSDHFTNPAGEYDQDSLELWMSLAYAASHTKSIEFGSLVAPVTFRHPSMQARYAAAIDDLSGGRLVLGMGAGWQEREHKRFGIPYHDFPTRYQMLEEALQVTRLLLRSDTPFDFNGQYFQLEDGILLPRPARPGGPPILIGGNGPRRTLPLVAKYADEWNADALDLDSYKARRAILGDYLSAEGRAVADVKYSLMTRVIYRQTQAQLDAFLHESGLSSEELRVGRMIVGTAAQVVDQIAARFEAGIDRVMLRWLELDDMQNLERLARDVLGQF
ncbi:MAG: TIGR03560 family F420-dependent LLM class oxidoreductase [Chloroflexi bacterium]|nr:TIGR03560 family F420-dependent LLM class oxidoreductase [Chloroflexota bacterium]